MRSLDHLSELEQIRRVTRNGNMIEHITRPSLNVQIAAVESIPTSIQYIDDPAIEVQLIAVRKSEWALHYIDEPNLSVQLASVQADGNSIRHLYDPLPMIQAAACIENPLAINSIKPIESIDISLLKKYRDVLSRDRLEYLKKFEKPLNESYDAKDPNTWSEEQQIEWIRDGGDWSTRIRRLKNPSEKVVITALIEDPYNLKYIVNPSLIVQLFAVKQQGKAIRFIKNQLPMLQWAAIKQNPYSIMYMPDPIEDVQLYAVAQDSSLINEIKNPTSKVVDFMRENYGYEYKRS